LTSAKSGYKCSRYNRRDNHPERRGKGKSFRQLTLRFGHGRKLCLLFFRPKISCGDSFKDFRPSQLPNNFPAGKKFHRPRTGTARRWKRKGEESRRRGDGEASGRISWISLELLTNAKSQRLWMFVSARGGPLGARFFVWETFPRWGRIERPVAAPRNPRESHFLNRRCLVSSYWTRATLVVKFSESNFLNRSLNPFDPWHFVFSIYTFTRSIYFRNDRYFN